MSFEFSDQYIWLVPTTCFYAAIAAIPRVTSHFELTPQDNPGNGLRVSVDIYIPVLCRCRRAAGTRGVLAWIRHCGADMSYHGYDT